MVFFQLNVTGLLFQSFRTASPSLSENATFSTYHRGLSHYRDPI